MNTKSTNTSSDLTTASEKVKEIIARSDIASESDIEEVTIDVAELSSPEESIFINGHEVRRTGDREWHVGTSYGDLVFDNPDAVARFCIRAGFSQKPGTTVELKGKVLALHERVARMEAELGLEAPEIRALSDKTDKCPYCGGYAPVLPGKKNLRKCQSCGKEFVYV